MFKEEKNNNTKTSDTSKGRVRNRERKVWFRGGGVRRDGLRGGQTHVLDWDGDVVKGRLIARDEGERRETSEKGK